MQRLSGMIIQKESILYQQIAYVSEKFYLSCCESTSDTNLKPDKILLSTVSSSGNKCDGNSTRSSDIVQDLKFRDLVEQTINPKNIAAWPQKSICNITPTRMTQQIWRFKVQTPKKIKRYEDDIRSAQRLA